jgi:ribosome biogenesis protein SSF1/2
MGDAQIKTRTHAAPVPAEEGEKLPKSFIIRRGKADRSVAQLVQDMRRMMSPYTATKLKVRK